MKTTKQVIYEVYKANKNTEYMTEDKLYEMTKLHITEELTKEDFVEHIKKIKEIEFSLSDDNNWAFGTELEFGGRNNRLSYDPDDEEDLIQTIKNDGSVSGDGTEYNLKPIYFKDLDDKRAKLESLCYRMAKKNCEIVPSAGEHIHYSWDGLEPYMGGIFKLACDNSYNRTQVWIQNEYKDEDSKKYLSFEINGWSGKGYRYENAVSTLQTSYEDRRKRRTNYDEYFKDKEETEVKSKTLYIMKTMQLLYSTSNRSGTESYGLGGDGTRGYTQHRTIEIRCWRTTNDYRSIIARAKIGRFVLQNLIRCGALEKEGYITYANEDIWAELRDNKDVLKAFKYLAFHYNNKHNCGLSEDDLEKQTLTTHREALAIKQRSKMIQLSLRQGSPEEKAKELFKEI